MEAGLLVGLKPDTADTDTHKRTLMYFNQLKESPDGWRLCAETFTSSHNQPQNDETRFFCLQVIEDYLITRYSQCDYDTHQYVRSILLTCLLIDSDGQQWSDKAFIKNKLAQLFSLAFVVDYPDRWPSFVSDILQVVNSPAAVDLYIRIFHAIGAELTDRDATCTQQVANRNTRIKDAMRDQDVVRLVDSLYHILVQYETSHSDLVRPCLDLVGAYVSWIDINLVANERFVAALMRFMRDHALRGAACDCIHEVINKGMDAAAKVRLIESFDAVLATAGLLDVKPGDDGEYMLKLARLINCMGVNLLSSWNKLVKAGEIDAANSTMVAMENKMALFIGCLGDEDDDVSQTVLPLAQDYITLLKQNPAISLSHRSNIERLMCGIIQKMKFDESYNFDATGEDEADFLDYRKQLKAILCNLAQLDSGLLMATTQELVTRTLSLWKSLDYRDIELAVYLLYVVGETLTSPGTLFSGEHEKSGPMKELMTMLVTSSVSNCGHTGVLLSYFETVVRYDKFFNVQPQLLPDVVRSFLDERGMRHTSPQIRSRAAYLFSRFIKTLRQHMVPYLGDILARLTDLLTLVTPDNGCQHLLAPNDQLFVYETISVLVISTPLPSQKKQSFMKELLSPIVTQFDDVLNKMVACTDPNKQTQYAQCLNNAMSLASRSSKGFSVQQTMRQCDCVALYTELLGLFIHASNAPVQRQLIHAGVRQFLHRMVVCLEGDILVFVPMATRNLLQTAGARDLADFLPFLNQLIQKFKKQILPFLRDILPSLVTTICDELNRVIDERDSEATGDRAMLRRQYYVTLSTVVTHNLIELFTHLAPSDLERVLTTTIQGANDCSEPATQKTCFSILRKLVDNWGDNTDVGGFGDFIYNHILPACLLVPAKHQFNLADAQSALVVGECAACLKCIHDKRGDEMLRVLELEILPTLNLPSRYIYQFCSAIKSDPKTLKQFLKEFYQKGKT